jgi:hypothetical protein
MKLIHFNDHGISEGSVIIFRSYLNSNGARGSAVVKALCCKLGSRGFETRCGE